MFLADTDVVSELRRGERAHPQVRHFFMQEVQRPEDVYLSVVSIGEFRRGIEMLRHRGDRRQAAVLNRWLEDIIEGYGGRILPFGHDEAEVWGRLRVPDPSSPIDKQIASTALTNGLIVATRKTRHFSRLGVPIAASFT